MESKIITKNNQVNIIYPNKEADSFITFGETQL